MTRRELAALPRPELDALATDTPTPWALPRWLVVERILHRLRRQIATR